MFTISRWTNFYQYKNREYAQLRIISRWAHSRAPFSPLIPVLGSGLSLMYKGFLHCPATSQSFKSHLILSSSFFTNTMASFAAGALPMALQFRNLSLSSSHFTPPRSQILGTPLSTPPLVSLSSPPQTIPSSKSLFLSHQTSNTW